MFTFLYGAFDGTFPSIGTAGIIDLLSGRRRNSDLDVVGNKRAWHLRRIRGTGITEALQGADSDYFDTPTDGIFGLRQNG